VGEEGGKAGSLIRKHVPYTPARRMRRDVRALTSRNHPDWRCYPMRRVWWEGTAASARAAGGSRSMVFADGIARVAYRLYIVYRQVV